MSTAQGFVHVAVVARSYGCEVTWLVRVHARGLLPTTPAPRGGPDSLSIAIEDLDRVAELVRWHLQLGVDLDVLEVLFRARL